MESSLYCAVYEKMFEKWSKNLIMGLTVLLFKYLLHTYTNVYMCICVLMYVCICVALSLYI
jgi:hypothetical protein